MTQYIAVSSTSSKHFMRCKSWLINTYEYMSLFKVDIYYRSSHTVPEMFYFPTWAVNELWTKGVRTQIAVWVIGKRTLNRIGWTALNGKQWALGGCKRKQKMKDERIVNEWWAIGSWVIPQLYQKRICNKCKRKTVLYKKQYPTVSRPMRAKTCLFSYRSVWGIYCT